MFKFTWGAIAMSLKNMQTRINYQGGARQVDRMVKDKERSFKGSLWRSYQSATVALESGKEFKCLINPNKLSMELDDKMLSIPFEDKCLTTNKQEIIDIRTGSVVKWKETNTHWLVYSRFLEEIAYFRGLMRQCENEPLEIIINGAKHQFYYYLNDAEEKGIDWQKSKHFIFNDLNYTVEMYISNNSITNEFFQRFTKCKIKGKPYEVQAVNRLAIDGLLVVYLKEDYTNEWAAEPVEEAPIAPPEQPVSNDRKITGPTQVYPYDIVQYEVLNSAPGAWHLSNKRAVIREQHGSTVTIEIVTGKSGNVSLIYKCDGMEDMIFNIEILSL